jgi:NAD(P)-dependent dehydrogenase (short-subunit alcohol dehydrogenase family)
MSSKTIFRNDLFAGQWAWVTGGGTGIGKRIARELCQLGATVVISGRREEPLLETKSLICKENASEACCHAITVNIRSVDSVNECLDEILKRSSGRLDMLVNSAGGQFPSLAADLSERGWRAVIDTNLNGTWFVMQQCYLRCFRRQQRGNIVTIVVLTRNGFPTMSHTAAARAGIKSLHRTLAQEWASDGVRLNCVAPGIIASSGLQTYPVAVREKIREQGDMQAYMTRLGTEEEVSAAALFLLSEGSAYTTAQCVNIDGGWSIYHPMLVPTKNDNHPAFQDDNSASAQVLAKL